MKARLQPNEKPDVETIKVSYMILDWIEADHKGDDSIHLRLSVHRYRLSSSRAYSSVDT